MITLLTWLQKMWSVTLSEKLKHISGFLIQRPWKRKIKPKLRWSVRLIQTNCLDWNFVISFNKNIWNLNEYLCWITLWINYSEVLKILFHYFSQQSISSKAKLPPSRQTDPFPVGHILVDQTQWEHHMLMCWQLQAPTYEALSLIIKKKRNIPRNLVWTRLEPNHFEMCAFGRPITG